MESLTATNLPAIVWILLTAAVLITQLTIIAVCITLSISNLRMSQTMKTLMVYRKHTDEGPLSAASFVQQTNAIAHGAKDTARPEAESVSEKTKQTLSAVNMRGVKLSMGPTTL